LRIKPLCSSLVHRGVLFGDYKLSRRKKEEGRRKKEEGRRKKEERKISP
jgi:hypothetical protein